MSWCLRELPFREGNHKRKATRLFYSLLTCIYTHLFSPTPSLHTLHTLFLGSYFELPIHNLITLSIFLFLAASLSSLPQYRTSHCPKFQIQISNSLSLSCLYFYTTTTFPNSPLNLLTCTVYSRFSFTKNLCCIILNKHIPSSSISFRFDPAPFLYSLFLLLSPSPHHPLDTALLQGNHTFLFRTSI